MIRVYNNYVTINHNEALKETKVLTRNWKKATKLMMYADESNQIPVASMKFYLWKLNPKQTAFFKRNRSRRNITSELIWYSNQHVGQNTISQFTWFMKNIFREASQTYTNHCIHATTITVLAHCSFNENCLKLL